MSSANVPFVYWIRTLIREKNALNTGKMAKGMRRGIGKLLDSGVTTVGDHISFDGDWKTIVDSPLKGILFGEVLGVLPEVCNDIYSTLRQIKQDIQTYGHTDIQTSRLSFHITPHSVHAVHPQTLEGIARGETGPFSIHLAESREEDDYFRKEAGPFIDLITERGIPPPHGRTTTIDFLLKMGFPLSELIAIHGNYFTEDELKLLSKSDASLVHCPGSHAYFGHRPFPLRAHLDRGLNVAIGTDSIASNTDLDFLLELKRIREKHPAVSPSEIIKMATLNGAKALRMEKEIGSLLPGKSADIAGFPLKRGLSPEESVLAATHASFLMIDGARIQ